MRLAAKGESGPLWVRALEQIDGKARRGRSWISPPGNLYSTLLLRAAGTAARLTELGFVAGLALHDAASAALADRGVQVSLKWPNDLLVDGAKASGMLLESGGAAPDQSCPLAIGIGLNLASHPPDTLYPVTHLAEHGSEMSPDDVFGRLARGFASRHAVWDGGRGFAAIRQAWCQRSSGIGGPVTVNLEDSTVTGIFDGIDETGALILRHADGRFERILAGDLFLPLPDGGMSTGRQK